MNAPTTSADPTSADPTSTDSSSAATISAGVSTDTTSRRGFLAAAGGIGAAAVLAACSGDQESTGGGDQAGGGPTGTVLATTDQVEVGGGHIAVDHSVVITQPTEGTFRAFSAVCTHQSCLVRTISDGAIICPCHGSQFSIEDGSVLVGANGGDPSSQGPLQQVPIEVSGDQIIRAPGDPNRR